MRILVAHQDAKTRGRLRRAARGLVASDVKVAASPEEALGRLREWNPDVVLMSASVAEHYSRHVSPLAEADVPPQRRVAELAPSDAVRRGQRPSRWDRDHAALELARVLLAIEADEVEPRSAPRRSPPEPAPGPRSPLDQLSSAEQEILGAVAAGSTPTELATERGIAEDVIDHHIADVLAKLQRLDLRP